ncbi:MAG: hypothetical protein ACHQ1D_08105 [Nitrososphaerales archaeon]
MFPLCHKCGIEMEPKTVVVSENNPEPYPQGIMRKYTCPKCGTTLVKEGIIESKRPPPEV